MKSILSKILSLVVIVVLFVGNSSFKEPQEFKGKAYYFSKTKMDLGNWGARFSEAQKKQVYERLKNRLNKSYVLSFTKEESFFKEEDKLDAMSGATDSWGKNFAQGDQYKNVKTNMQIQNQEFYGKRFLVKDNLQPIEWQMGSETKVIGNYECYKATASVPTSDLSWYSFSWDRLRNNQNQDEASTETNEVNEVPMTEIEAWYTPQIPVRHGPSEFWGLPGLILEVSADNTTMLCSKIVINPDEELKIEAPTKGKEINKKDYQTTIVEKMKEFRNNRMGRRRG